METFTEHDSLLEHQPTSQTTQRPETNIKPETETRDFQDPNFDDPLNYYAVLGVPREASPELIKRAYRKHALKFHPDKNHSPNAEGDFNTIKNAYEVLSDEQKKRMYDSFGAEGAQYAQYIWMIKPFVYILCCILGFFIAVAALLYDTWLVLTITNLEKELHWKISAVNVPLYILLFFYMLNLPNTRLGKVFGLIEFCTGYLGLILFFVRVDCNKGDYHLWLIPAYIACLFRLLKMLREDLGDYVGQGENGEVINIPRKKRVVLLNGVLDLLENVTFIGLIVSIGVSGNEKDYMYAMIFFALYLVFRVVRSALLDLHFSRIKLVYEIVVCLFYAAQGIMLGSDVGVRCYKYSYAIAFIPALLYGVIITAIPLIVCPLICCFLPPLLEKVFGSDDPNTQHREPENQHTSQQPSQQYQNTTALLN
ncbi:hypothetical protein EIN_281520 [Entamoeba invadens IP1]|uniref:J domain-containing protein n=1 Tax=Entamoeba invadens IP1 TaxID=370355 RepID=A0A0A1TZZ0_ENTIV|nr:hypothetical protein EIN_281520 [Entamoeba invadens IP1]ELP85781.1 hypothetical protein EIN_281520 [Entamoeba invadens IP1]|eukprot:XP_004185127.1 hypothetical protein EIN_281520 [Entamoeba invadens IP1]